MEIIPAIDIIDGKCVRLTQGDFQQMKVYNEDPLTAAKQFEEIGIRRIHVVDLDGAKAGMIKNINVLERIAKNTNLIIDFGGGIKTDECIQHVFDAGASIATIGSIAVKNKDLFFSWIEKYGAYKILLGADVKGERITINGWSSETDISIFDFLDENISKGVKNIFCTDVSKDGMMEGPAIELYSKLIDRFPDVKMIASGGVASIHDLNELKKVGCSGVIIGKAIYENKISMDELKLFLY